MTTLRKRLTWVAAAAAVLAAAILPAVFTSAPGAHLGAVAPSAPVNPAPVICGSPILNSPWSYSGGATTFTSGQFAGLPTYGSPGTSFPNATAGMIVAAGDNTSAAQSGTYQVNNTIVYFEPGEHQVKAGMFTGHDSVYIGGYNAGSGEATIDGVDGGTNGTGVGGSNLSSSTPSSGNTVNDTWEYLTIKNYSSSKNNSVMGNINGGSTDDGDTYKYDTIGPNNYSFAGSGVPPAQGQGNQGGYGIDGNNNTTIQYTCMTRNSQGGFNTFNAINLNVSNNEISWNSIGEYPDDDCGCSAGGKAFYTLNANIVNNYVHDNYNVGIWLDFDNDGASISHNYIASNWSSGIFLEASYNSSISANTLTGNGWASDGAWPSGSCFGGVSCTNGNGPVTGNGGGNPFGAIDLSDSGGVAALGTVHIPASVPVPGCASSCSYQSRYSGKLLISGNSLINNFGGVKVYTDSNRYPGNINGDSACSMPLGALDQQNSTLYYQQSKILVTAADSSVTGSAVVSTGGTTTICSDYGLPWTGDDSAASVVTAPDPGMAVFNQNTGAFLGNVNTVTNATHFTLTASPGNVTGANLLVSAYGGCGPTDYFNGSAGVSSGTPSAPYWDNCNWGSRNVIVAGNKLSMDAAAVTGCTTLANLCGFQYDASFNPGIPTLLTFWSSMQSLMTLASGGLGNVFSGNAYTWTGGGSGAWIFTKGNAGNGAGNTFTWSQWQGSPNNQDAGSSGPS